MARLPPDLELLRKARKPLVAGLRWCEEGETPAGYVDVEELDARGRASRKRMFRELHWPSPSRSGVSRPVVPWDR